MTIPKHLNDDGTITHEWMLGHADPKSVTEVRITRYELRSNLHPGKSLAYGYAAKGGLYRDYGTGIAACRRFLRRNFPNARVIETWH